METRLDDLISITCDILQKARFEILYVDFNGEDDSGCIQDIARYNMLPTALFNKKIFNDPVKGIILSRGKVFVQKGIEENYQKDLPLKEIIETICYKLLEKSHPGWEIGDGAYGRFIFLPQERKVKMEFYERIIEDNYSEDEYNA